MINFGLGLALGVIGMGFLHLHYSGRIAGLEAEVEAWAKRAYNARVAASAVKITPNKV